MSVNEHPLSSADQKEFIERGYIRLRGCFSKAKAREMEELCFKRLGYDPKDMSTWKEPRIHMGGNISIDPLIFAPKAWYAACQLLGGEKRVKGWNWGDHFIINLNDGAERAWEPPSPKVPGWHKDGDFFLHFLDSPEQGLLSLVCWTDVLHKGGATFVAPDSVGVISRYLAEHPEGVNPFKFPFKELIGQCKEFVEVQGEAGDVFLLHPYILHASSQNALKKPRIITNPPIQLKDPMKFNRHNAADFSPVERGVLRGLGVERYNFVPTAPREKIVPQRVKDQEKRMAEEKMRQAMLQQQ